MRQRVNCGMVCKGVRGGSQVVELEKEDLVSGLRGPLPLHPRLWVATTGNMETDALM